jgi:hypothetical protein
MAIFKEFMHCVNTPFHSQILHLFQFADEMSNSHIYKFSQNLETQKKYISMKNSQFFNYLLYTKSK